MPARNCARPPNIAANGANTSPDAGVPHQPARFEATMNVALAKPARPRIEGAAIGWRNTRGRAKPSSQAASSTPAKAFCRRSSSVLIVEPPYFRSCHDLISPLLIAINLRARAALGGILLGGDRMNDNAKWRVTRLDDLERR